VCVVLASVCHISCFGVCCNKNSLLTCASVFFTLFNCTFEEIHVEVDVLLGKLVLAWCSICSNFHVVLEAILMYGSSS
jgi:hypothetical protein